MYVCIHTHLFWGQWFHQVEGAVGDVGAASVQPLHGNMGGVEQLTTNLSQVHCLTKGCRYALRGRAWEAEVPISTSVRYCKQVHETHSTMSVGRRSWMCNKPCLLQDVDCS